MVDTGACMISHTWCKYALHLSAAPHQTGLATRDSGWADGQLEGHSAVQVHTHSAKPFFVIWDGLQHGALEHRQGNCKSDETRRHPGEQSSTALLNINRAIANQTKQGGILGRGVQGRLEELERGESRLPANECSATCPLWGMRIQKQ